MGRLLLELQAPTSVVTRLVQDASQVLSAGNSSVFFDGMQHPSDSSMVPVRLATSTRTMQAVKVWLCGKLCEQVR